MAVELFKCSFCGKNKRMEFLAEVLDKSGAMGDIRERIKHTEELKLEAYTNYLTETDGENRQELLNDVKDYDSSLKAMYERVSKSKEAVCSACVVKGKQKAKVPTFVCRLCGEEKQGKGTELHVDDWQDEGISPSDLHVFCRVCINDHALAPPPNFHCPRDSYGRDDWSMDKQRFSCNCQVKGITY